MQYHEIIIVIDIHLRTLVQLRSAVFQVKFMEMESIREEFQIILVRVKDVMPFKGTYFNCFNHLITFLVLTNTKSNPKVRYFGQRMLTSFLNVESILRLLQKVKIAAYRVLKAEMNGIISSGRLPEYDLYPS